MTRHAYLRLLRSPLTSAVPLVVLALNAAMPHVAFSYPLGQTLMNLLIALAIHRVVVLPESFSGRLLNRPAVAGLGAMSYSLHLWQQPFLHRASVSSLAAFPLNVVLAWCAALISYRLVERPALRFPPRVPISRALQTHAAVN